MNGIYGFPLAILILMSSQNLSGQTTSPEVIPHRSMVITNVNTVNQLAQSFDMGFQLGQVNEWLELTNADILPNWRMNWTNGKFIAMAIKDAFNEQVRHQSAPRVQQLGGPILPNRFLDSVFRNWMSDEELSQIDDLNGLRGGPFRLLAVVNRMDAAGDFDDRGNSQATHDPRALGEVHLVYGLVDKDFENRAGKAFPMTFVLAYRLPALIWQGGRYVRDPRFTQRDLMSNENVWSFKMHQWAKLWTDLSNHVPGTSAHTNRLANILRLAVSPENLIHLRSNTQVNATEFELREWYILENTKTMIRRKPRDEPYKCSSNSVELAKVVQTHWSVVDNDVDVTTRDPLYRRFRGLNGFSIPGDNLTPVLAEYDFYSGCGLKADLAPFGMFFEGNDAVIGARAVFNAPFARTTKDFVWELNLVPENRRHAFAIRSCSGCHGAEAAANGFHVAPRLANERSRLSPFMTGRGQAYFDRGGRRYRYSEIAKRQKLLMKYLNREAKPFDGLFRTER